MRCEKCGYGYVPEVPENRKLHRKYHDGVVNGLRAPRALSDRIVWERDDLRITVVNSQSPIAQRKRAEGIGRLANHDTGYDSLPYTSGEPLDARNVHLFLGYAADRGIGFLKVEKRAHMWRCTWELYGGKQDPPKLPCQVPIWSVGLAWVHGKHRLKGWARRLTEQAARFFGVEIQSLGWYIPFSSDGEKLVRCLCPDWFYIVR